MDQFVQYYSLIIKAILIRLSFHLLMLVLIFKQDTDLYNIFYHLIQLSIFLMYQKELGNRFV
jgi:hypothetical protein